MWIIIRLLLAALGFGLRFWRRRWPNKVKGEHKGAPYYLKKHKTKKKTIAVTIGMPMETRSWIRMHRESRVDRFFKRIGIASEMETGDPEFDERVYVTSDRPAVATLLTGSAELRAAVMRSLGIVGAACVSYDGSAIWVEKIRGSEVIPLHLETLAELREASTPLRQVRNRWFDDHFLRQALLIEGLIWAIFGYAAGAYIDYAEPIDLHLWTDPLVWTGLLVGLLALVGILASIALWMRGSSRGHRILVESAVVLAFGLPVAGIQVVADSNRALDDSPAQTVTLDIDRCEVRETGSGRRKRETYYAVLFTSSDRPPGQEVPSEIRVTPSLCYALRRGNVVELEIGAGRWGFPWYRQIRTGDETWTAPL